MPKNKKQKDIKVQNISHKKAVRKHILTAEKRPTNSSKPAKGKVATYQHRDPDLDPQLVWRCKYEGDAELKVPALPLYIQEKVHPKYLIDDLMRESKIRANEAAMPTPDLFADFNGLRGKKDKADFYKHDAGWTNRLILGDALQAMASLSENEGLRGQVQCIYIDPPYGIKFNSNFQWSTTDREVKDGKRAHCTREAEQLKAFRDTWRDGIHTYLSYLKDRLLLAHELLNESGSVFVQIGDENAHRVRLLLDEVFGDANFIREIFFAKTGSLTSKFIGRTGDRILWYGKKKEVTKFHPLFEEKVTDNYYKLLENAKSLRFRTLKSDEVGLPSTEFASEGKIYRHASVEGANSASEDTPFEFQGETWRPAKGNHWSVSRMDILAKSGRLVQRGSKLEYKLYLEDFPIKRIMDVWRDTSGFVSDQRYVVETRPKVVERCLLMTTDPGDLVLDPTCGSGTTAYVAEQWGRRWITMDTSRVALALARARIMGARYPWYILADSDDGRRKLAEIEEKKQVQADTYGNVRLGFIYERKPHITMSTISNNTEIDLIWDKWQKVLLPLRKLFNSACGEAWEEWQIPSTASAAWDQKAKKLHKELMEKLIERREEMEASIAERAGHEFLRDKPYQDDSIVRVSGPFTVESLSPHRTLSADEHGEFFSASPEGGAKYGEAASFAEMILNYLKASGVQQANKKDRITFTSIMHRPGRYLPFEGRFEKANKTCRAGIFIGPEFGTVMQDDLEQAVKEANEAGFDVMIACAFNYDAHVAEVNELERGGGGKSIKGSYESRALYGRQFC